MPQPRVENYLPKIILDLITQVHQAYSKARPDYLNISRQEKNKEEEKKNNFQFPSIQMVFRDFGE